MVDRLKPAVDIDKYKSSLYTPLPGHMGPDGKILLNLKFAEVAGRLAALRLQSEEIQKNLVQVTVETLHELYPDALQSYLSVMVAKYAYEEGPLSFYSSLQGILGDIRNDSDGGK